MGVKKYVTLCLLFSIVIFVIVRTLYLCDNRVYLVREWPEWAWESSTEPVPSFRYVRVPRDVCPSSSSATSLVAGIATSADHFDQRSAIRETWGGALREIGFTVLFLLGESKGQTLNRRILEEGAFHRDILQGEFADTYGNLTYKTVMFLRWVNEFCSKAKFVLKIDDDVFLNIWDLAEVLRNVSGIKHTMWGHLFRGYGPNRKNTSKWYVSKESYTQNVYPDFLSGTAYLISADSIPVLAKSTYNLPFYGLEDVYLTGFIGERTGIRRLNMDGFSITKEPIQPCAIPKVLTSHEWTPRQLRSAWKNTLSRLNMRLCEGL